MIPSGDHHTRSLLLRRISSWSRIQLQEFEPRAEGYSLLVDNDGDTNHDQQPVHNLLQSLLPEFEFEQPAQSDRTAQGMISSDQENDQLGPLNRGDEGEHIHQQRDQRIAAFFPHARASKNVKLYLVFVLLIVCGVGNVTLAKLQALPM